MGSYLNRIGVPEFLTIKRFESIFTIYDTLFYANLKKVTIDIWRASLKNDICNTMNKKDPKLTVLLFNECINNQDIGELGKFMAEDVKLIMGNEVTQNSKEEAVNAWMQFFEMCPDYKNHFKRIESREDIVCVVGYSTCSNKSVDGPALWRVRIENDLISEWQILEDNEDNRKFLEFQD